MAFYHEVCRDCPLNHVCRLQNDNQVEECRDVILLDGDPEKKARYLLKPGLWECSVCKKKTQKVDYNRKKESK